MRRDIRDVASPTSVGAIGGEVLLEQILCQAMGRITLRRRPKAPLGTSPQPLQAHQLSNLVASDAHPLGHQLSLNPRAAVNPFACFVDAPDLHQQFAITLRPGTLRTPPPSVVTARRDSQQGANRLGDTLWYCSFDSVAPPPRTLDLSDGHSKNRGELRPREPHRQCSVPKDLVPDHS